MKIKRITRKEFESFPKFKDVEEAIKFFKEKYGDHFIEQACGPLEEIELGRYYPHMLIIDKEVHKRLSEWMNKQKYPTYPGDNPDTKGFGESFQTIIIFEDGRVQVSNLAEE
ncbi:hypothetical protein [Bacillus subtilis]|uniref:hypothetical protein n=1 Tax=Bacillus subtilis TaxID=1423 RepID=UPI0025A210B5|nr:hypothetical protein [Bacillus subtilis]MDM5455666.1 hypothetical protein [Bacillus subtilis]